MKIRAVIIALLAAAGMILVPAAVASAAPDDDTVILFNASGISQEAAQATIDLWSKNTDVRLEPSDCTSGADCIRVTAGDNAPCGNGSAVGCARRGDAEQCEVVIASYVLPFDGVPGETLVAQHETGHCLFSRIYGMSWHSDDPASIMFSPLSPGARYSPPADERKALQAYYGTN